MKHLWRVNRYFAKYGMRYLAGLSFVVVSNYFAILAPQITAYVVDKVQQLLPGYAARPLPKQSDPLVAGFVGWLEQASFGYDGIIAICGISILLLALVRGFFMFWMRQTIIVASRYIEYDQKNEVYAHYQRLHAGFYKMTNTGDLMNRISEDVGRVRMYTGPAIMYLANLVTMIVLAVYYMLQKDVTLTLYVLAPLPVLSITIYWVNTIIHKRSKKIQAILSDLTTDAQQAYSGIRVIKSYVDEPVMMAAFDQKSDAYRQENIGLAKVEAIYSPSMWLLIGLSNLITIMMGGMYYLQGRIAEVGVLVEFIMYINMLMFPVSAIGWVASMIQRAAASQSRINDLLDLEPEIRDNEKTNPATLAEGWSGAIAFQDVSFRYPNTGIQALKQVSFRLKAGEKVAIIGRTGSGKSTIAQLLLRMFDTSEGSITLDGQDIRSIPLERLRSLISYVPQEVFLFSDTVAGNIRFGYNDAPEEALESAAKMASVHQEIMGFADGYQTMVGERGVTLSGGQKQRVSIARALLKPAQLIIFDDCLSAVDAATEQAVLGSLADYLQDKTAIIITHRIFSLLQFDHILVLDHGHIAESGTHLDLLAKNGLYADLYRRQQYEIEAAPEVN